MSVFIIVTFQIAFSQRGERGEDRFASLALEFHDELVRSDELSYLHFLREFNSSISRNPSRFEMGVRNRLLGSYHLKFAQPGDALTYQLKALHYFLSLEDYSEASRIANDMGNAYLLLDNQPEAQKNYHLSMHLADFSTHEEDRFVSYYNYARLKLAQEDTVYAIALLQTYRDACQHFEKYESMSDCYSLMAEIALAQNRKELAKNYFTKALNSSKMTDSKLAEANVLANQAILTFQQGDTSLASTLFHRALEKRLEIGNKRMIADAYFNLGSFHFFNERQDSAIYYFEKTRDFTLSNDLFLDAVDAIEVLQQITLLNNEKLKYSVELKEVQELKSRSQAELKGLINEIERSFEESDKSLPAGFKLPTLMLVLLLVVLLIFILDRAKINSIWQDTQD